MSSPFQRAFSSKHPLKETNYHDPELKRQEAGDLSLTEGLPKKETESKKPSLRDVAAGPTRPLFPAQRVWEKAKKVYQAIDTPEERTAIKDKLVEGWKNIKGPRSTRVGN